MDVNGEKGMIDFSVDYIGGMTSQWGDMYLRGALDQLEKLDMIDTEFNDSDSVIIPGVKIVEFKLGTMKLEMLKYYCAKKEYYDLLIEILKNRGYKHNMMHNDEIVAVKCDKEHDKIIKSVVEGSMYDGNHPAFLLTLMSTFKRMREADQLEILVKLFINYFIGSNVTRSIIFNYERNNHHFRAIQNNNNLFVLDSVIDMYCAKISGNMVFESKNPGGVIKVASVYIDDNVVMESLSDLLSSK
ncbi:MAG: hypothetical protein P9L92_06050 [Candidatus Electryonea clarkiae]|nr:hypothetical protein [Candidatus Electryonea clarkiae]